MADSGKIISPKPDSPSSNQSQKVEVVVASSSDGDVNILGELATFVLRVGFSLFMIHHGLEKLNDPEGFAEFVVGKYFGFLPGDPIIWTYAAGITQVICPICGTTISNTKDNLENIPASAATIDIKSENIDL